MNRTIKKFILTLSLFLLSMVIISAQVNLNPGQSITIEAENASLNQALFEDIHSGYSGSGYINYENESGSYIEWTVNVSSDGPADCVFVFANGGGSRPVDVTVNGSFAASYNFTSTGEWTNWTYASVVISLFSGNNSIRLTATASEGGPNIDRMEITFNGSGGSSGNLGDVNNDGSINIIDALMTAQFYVGLDPQGFIRENADVNNDGNINIIDALIMAQIYVGLVPPPATYTPRPTPHTPTPTSPPTNTPTTPPVTNAIYASPSGSSGNSGTSFNDALDIKTALGRVSSGQTLLLQAGTYKISYSSGKKSTITLSKSGSSSKQIRVEGSGGKAKIDFQFPNNQWVQDSYGLYVTGDYYYFKNIDITRSGYQGAYVTGDHNTFDTCRFYSNRNTGLEINKGGSNTTVRDCDSYDNFDLKNNGEMADGFAPKQTQGSGNKFYNCDAWGNSDDGVDCYDSDKVVIFENCTANDNGRADGNGNGFKVGGNGKKASHELTDCVANDNRKHGFHANSNPGPIYLYNCSASGNGGNDFNGDGLVRK